MQIRTLIQYLSKKVFGKNRVKNSVGTLNEATRNQWIKSTLRKIPNGGTILDAGAGEQQYKKWCHHLNYVSQDFAEYKPDAVNAGLQMKSWDYGELDIVSDIATIPLKDKSVDAILCTEVFEHIINPKEAITEFARLIKQDGYLIITAPFCSLTHFAPYHFYSGFNSYFYQSELTNNGFEIIEITKNGNYFEYLAQELRRLPKMGLQYSGYKLNRNEVKKINEINNLLQEISSQDSGSGELLCFGYHVLARRK